ncbi:MAG: UDP-N-acetylmuramoyl-L-alanine--D-glutamate ligase [Xanthomonadaceae bacterium]|nr:UDP-N-acetylmuramoyl-L-alanine--D-glutamate ligase [Xanthomonadaceae bacterium]
MRMHDLVDARVAVWGYGREGRAALAALRRRFPHKQLTLLCAADERAHVSDDANLDVITGTVAARTLQTFDVIVKSPGISPYKPPISEAVAAGVKFTSATALWFAENPAARARYGIVGVTGTKGKSTTSAMIAHGARALGIRTALAGNIGMPLLDLEGQQAELWVVELSSFQTAEAGPLEVGVITNLYEEHLDWHGTGERYAADKLKLADAARTLIVNADQPALLARTAAHTHRVLFADAAGWHARDGAIRRGDKRLLPMAQLPVPGEHNAQNVCAALAALEALGLDAVAALPHLSRFKPLPHRLHGLGSRAGLEYINDSIATTPQATIEALRSLDNRMVTVIVGGFDRGVDWSGFVNHVRVCPPHAIIASGANGTRIAEALCTLESPRFELLSAPTLEQAVGVARACTPAGGVVLLSPGAPSFDRFRDYAERGREFARLAGFDPASIANIEGLGVA